MNIWGYGDSFLDDRHDGVSWLRYIEDNLYYDTVKWSTESSRSLRCIIDRFLIDMHKFDKNDLIFLIVPAPRFDVPIIEHTIKGYKHYFVGVHQFEPGKQHPFSDSKTMRTDKDIDNFFKLNPTHHVWKAESPIYQYNILHENSEPTRKNYIDILKSLKTMFPKLTILGWTTYLVDDIILSKNVLESKIGMWETMDDVWRKTGTPAHWKSDSHWSPNMEIEVGKFLVNYLNDKYEDIKIKT